MSALPRELPADREKALEAISMGWARRPTMAHPDCYCGRRAQFQKISWSDVCGWHPVPVGFVVTVPCPMHAGRR